MSDGTISNAWHARWDALEAAQTAGDRLAAEHRELAQRYGCDVGDLPRLRGMAGHTDCKPYELGDHCGGCDECMWKQLAHSYATDGAP